MTSSKRHGQSLFPTWMLPVACVVMFVTAGCHDTRYQAYPPPADGEEVPILHQKSGAHSHETRAMQMVIRDPQSLAQVPIADVPVNFAEQMLLVVTLGQVTSDQYGIKIDRVWREGGRLRVALEAQAPSGPVPIAMASPYCIAVVPRCELNVEGFITTPPARMRSWEQSPPPQFGAGAQRNKKPPNYNPEAKR